MTKCKLATDSECGKVCCCLECEDRKTCQYTCAFISDETITVSEDCKNAVPEGGEMIAFQEKTLTVIQAIAEIEIKKKELDEMNKKMREQLEAAMEQYNIKSFENDLVKITYTEPTTRSSVDSAKLKKNYPDIYTECSKVSEVKGSVRITVK